MRIKTPLTGARLKNHFTYYFWAYALIVVISIFGWNLLYTMTAYKPPENKRIDLYIQSSTASDQSTQNFIAPIWESCVPEMEIVNPIILTSSTQDYYGAMQLATYVMAQEGDIYLLSTNDFKSYAQQGLFLDLQPFIDDGRLNLEGLDLSAGYVALVDSDGIPVGERRLFGIPLYTLYGYIEGMGLDNRDLVLGVTMYNGNEENVIAFLNGFIQAGRAEKPEWLE